MKTGSIREAIRISAVALSLLIVSMPSMAQSDGNDDPSVAEIPSLMTVDLDERRAIVLEVAFGPGETSTLRNVDVSKTAPGAMDDDPAFLGIMVFNFLDLPIHDQNTWDPRFRYQESTSGSEEVVYVEESVGIFILPFDPEFRSLAIFNLRGEPAPPLLEVDLYPLITEFCEANPDDINCASYVAIDIFRDKFELSPP